MRLITSFMVLAVIFLFGNLALLTLKSGDRAGGVSLPYGELSPEVRLMVGHLRGESNQKERTVTAIKSNDSVHLQEVGRIMKSAIRFNFLH